jgi:Holliday junction resolvase
MASIFQTKVKKAFQEQGYKVLNVIKLSENGYPDLMAMKEGKTIFIECKEVTDTLKTLQKLRIDELIELGFDAVCLKDKKGIIYGKSKTGIPNV